MKPAAFDYFAPATSAEVVALLEQHGDDAKILAGGQSLVPMMNFRLVQPQCLVDINRVEGLSYIEERAGRLHVGALTRQRQLERSALVRARNPLLLEGVRLIGHTAIRTRGTVGGSIVHADPTAELPTMLAALDGEVRVAGPAGQRTIGWQDLFLSYFTTALEPTELCDEVIIPVLPAGAGWAYEEFTHRHGDFAITGVCVIVEPGTNGACGAVRIAVAGVGPTPVRARDAEQFLSGQTPADATLEEAGRRVAAGVEPEADMHATENYRRHLAATLTTRALRRAVARLGQHGRE